MLAAALGKAPTRRRGRSTPVTRLDLGLGHAQLGEDRLGVAQQDLAGRRQRDAARVAHEQPRAELALQARDLLRDGRLGERERRRGIGERAARGDLAEDGEQTCVEHNATLSVREGNIIGIYPRRPGPSSHDLHRLPHHPSRDRRRRGGPRPASPPSTRAASPAASCSSPSSTATSSPRCRSTPAPRSPTPSSTPPPSSTRCAPRPREPRPAPGDPARATSAARCSGGRSRVVRGACGACAAQQRIDGKGVPAPRRVPGGGRSSAAFTRGPRTPSAAGQRGGLACGEHY